MRYELLITKQHINRVNSELQVIAKVRYNIIQLWDNLDGNTPITSRDSDLKALHAKLSTEIYDICATYILLGLDITVWVKFNNQRVRDFTFRDGKLTAIIGNETRATFEEYTLSSILNNRVPMEIYISSENVPKGPSFITRFYNWYTNNIYPG